MSITRPVLIQCDVMMMTSGAELRISNISCDCSILIVLALEPLVNVRKLDAVDDGAGDGRSYLSGWS